MKEFPLYPNLTEAGEEEAQKLLDRFKEQMKKIATEVIGDLYCDVALYIESDSWTNFRNEIMDGYRNYNNRKIQAEYDFAKIREAIYKEYREELIKDLNQDMVKEVEELKKQLKDTQESIRDFHRHY